MSLICGRALQFILDRDGGDQFLARVIKNLRRYAGQRPAQPWMN